MDDLKGTKAFPAVSEIGDLFIEEIPNYYDGPRLFTARTLTGRVFLCVFAHSGEGENETWMYVEMSESRLRDLQEGRVDLHDAFAEPEQGFVIAVPTTDSQVLCSYRINAEDVDPDWIPCTGEMFLRNFGQGSESESYS